jgi:acetyl esterase/lipase
VARQLLVYPMLDDRTTTPDLHILPFAGWSYDDNTTAWNALLGPGHEHREVAPPTAPGRLQDAADLPPAYIEVGQPDIFRDEDVRYALTLSRAGALTRARAGWVAVRPSWSWMSAASARAARALLMLPVGRALRRVR